MTDSPAAPVNTAPKIDTTRAHTARIWNYWLGGKDNYPIDRQVGDQIRQLHPGIGDYARADRVFLGRAVQYLARDAGIRQFRLRKPQDGEGTAGCGVRSGVERNDLQRDVRQVGEVHQVCQLGAHHRRAVRGPT